MAPVKRNKDTALTKDSQKAITNWIKDLIFFVVGTSQLQTDFRALTTGYTLSMQANGRAEFSTRRVPSIGIYGGQWERSKGQEERSDPKNTRMCNLKRRSGTYHSVLKHLGTKQQQKVRLPAVEAQTCE
jgi:hypothetical protein